MTAQLAEKSKEPRRDFTPNQTGEISGLSRIGALFATGEIPYWEIFDRHDVLHPADLPSRPYQTRSIGSFNRAAVNRQWPARQVGPRMPEQSRQPSACPANATFHGPHRTPAMRRRIVVRESGRSNQDQSLPMIWRQQIQRIPNLQQVRMCFLCRRRLQPAQRCYALVLCSSSVLSKWLASSMSC